MTFHTLLLQERLRVGDNAAGEHSPTTWRNWESCVHDAGQQCFSVDLDAKTSTKACTHSGIVSYYKARCAGIRCNLHLWRSSCRGTRLITFQPGDPGLSLASKRPAILQLQRLSSSTYHSMFQYSPCAQVSHQVVFRQRVMS